MKIYWEVIDLSDFRLSGVPLDEKQLNVYSLRIIVVQFGGIVHLKLRVMFEDDDS